MKRDYLRTVASTPDLRPQPGAPIEWWFVQGRIDKGVETPVHFMVAFFQVRQNSGRGSVGHMLLANAVDDRGAQRLARSEISHGIVQTHREIAERLLANRFSPKLAKFVLQRHMEESEKIRCENGPHILNSHASLASDRMAICWDGFELHQQGDHLRLHLSSEIGRNGDLAVDLALTPKRSWLDETGPNLSPDRPQPYAYRSCPRAELTGTLNNHPVSGTAWIERQWSGTFDNWFIGETGTHLQPLGWDWLGVSLDNGEDIIAHQQTVDNGKPIGQSSVVVFRDMLAERVQGSFELINTESWTSPRNGIAYPIGRKLVVPALGANLRIEPIALDQEVSVFGAPAIWEGAVRVSGRSGGRAVRGHGRLELFGYGYTVTLPQFLARKVWRAIMPNTHLPRNTEAGERDTV
ncbi:MAG: hypothetical protein NXI27_15800 [Alphaproteobacteria bacterium]|nr:hypothetical protein [Alphaproteobacteria bacterium]